MDDEQLQEELETRLDRKVRQIRQTGQMKINQLLAYLQRTDTPSDFTSPEITSNRSETSEEEIQEKVKEKVKDVLERNDEVDVSNPDSIAADVGKEIVGKVLGTIL